MLNFINFLNIIIYYLFIYTKNYFILFLGIGDWGLGIGPNPQSPIPNPQSPILFILLKNLYINNLYS